MHIHRLRILAAAMLPICMACSPAAERPSFEYASDSVCDDVVGVAWSQDSYEEFIGAIKLQALGRMAAQTYRFELGKDEPAHVFVNVYPKPAEPRPPYRTGACSDVIEENIPRPSVWVAIAGIVEVTTSSPPPPPYPQERYEVEMQFKGLVFRGPDGQLIEAPSVGPLRGMGGWSPG